MKSVPLRVIESAALLILFELDGKAVVDIAGFEVFEEFLFPLDALLFSVDPRGHDREEEVDRAETERGHSHDVAHEGETYRHVRWALSVLAPVG